MSAGQPSAASKAGRLRRWRIAAVALVVVILAGGIFLLWRSTWSNSAETDPGKQPVPSTSSLGPIWFDDVTAASGVDFVHFDSATPMHYIHETIGSGVAWIDYDNDGWADLCFVQAGPLIADGSAGPPPTHKMYRNNRDGTFTDVTKEVGLDQSGFGLGVAVG